MDRTVICARIHRIQDDMIKLKATLSSMEHTDPETYLGNYNMLATDAALLSEQIACKIRHLVYGSTPTRKDQYLVAAGNAQGIRICETDGVLEISLPCLLPKKKQRQSTEFLLDPLFFSLSQYAEAHILPMYRQCVVCFCHIYDQTLPASHIRDYDNLEMKQILDVIATFIMSDDSGILVDAYNTTELGETDCTRICVMSKNRFQKWLAERENRLESISDFQ